MTPTERTPHILTTIQVLGMSLSPDQLDKFPHTCHIIVFFEKKKIATPYRGTAFFWNSLATIQLNNRMDSRSGPMYNKRFFYGHKAVEAPEGNFFQLDSGRHKKRREKKTIGLRNSPRKYGNDCAGEEGITRRLLLLLNNSTAAIWGCVSNEPIIWSLIGGSPVFFSFSAGRARPVRNTTRSPFCRKAPRKRKKENFFPSILSEI